MEIARPLKEFNGIYCTHMRDETEQVMESLDESFRVGRELDVPVVISHHKVMGTRSRGRSKETLLRIAEAMRSQPVCLDCYPYRAASTMLSYARTLICSRVIVSSSRPHPQFAGMDLDEVVRKMGLPVEEAIAKLQPASAIYFSMDEADVQRILSFEHTMIGSDGLPHGIAPHPRLWGCFPRVLGHYSRDLKLFPLETAVRKMTGLPAKTFGLKDRGVLRGGLRGHHRFRFEDRGRHRDVGAADPSRTGHRRDDRQRRSRLARRQADRRKVRAGVEKAVKGKDAR